MKIAMIMLAAGNSRRFGSNKLLYEIDGIPMYQRILTELKRVKHNLDNIRESRSEQRLSNPLIEDKTEITLTVVTQYREIGEYAKNQGAEVLYNPHPEQGISSSLKIGLKANRDTADACLFCVSDQPWLTAETLCGLIDTFLTAGRTSKKGIACLSHDGKLGNPVFFRVYYDELLALEGDKGGKRVINAHLEDTEIYTISDKRELEDMDFLPEKGYTGEK